MMDIEHVVDTETNDDTVSGYCDVLVDSSLDDSYIDSDSTLVIGEVGDDTISDRSDWSTSSIELKDSDARSRFINNLENSDIDYIFFD